MNDLESYFSKGLRPHSYPFLPFSRYLELLLKWNEKINLTSITDPKKIIEEHFIDSLAAVDYLQSSTRILDIGSGAGFPGIPLAIALPNSSVTLCDSIKKKTDFIKEVVRQLKLFNVTVETVRLDTESKIGVFDAVVSRGTMEIKELLNLSWDLLKPNNGRVISYKGPDVYRELARLNPDQFKYELKSYSLPFSLKERKLVIIYR